MSTSVETVFDEVTVGVFDGSSEANQEWDTFLASSNNGTLFHDIKFLAYHNPERFETRHLFFRHRERLAAILPAAIVAGPNGERVLKSPYGASVGGMVLPADQPVVATSAIVSALMREAAHLHCSAVELRLGPCVYHRKPNDTLSFVLSALGFCLTRRWLTHVVPLPQTAEEALLLIANKRRRTYVNSALRKGLKVDMADVNALDEFYPLLVANRAKHGATPTHTLEELRKIFSLVPQRAKLFVCSLDNCMVAGSVVFELNDRVAYSFYPCHDDRFENHRPATLMAVCLAKHYIERGYRYLELGPSTFDDYSINVGLARFKEEVGSVGYCRDAWIWHTPR